MSSPTKLREMAKELGWPPELTKAADQLQKLKRENAELRAAAVEVCALARVLVTVWGDKISAESIKRLGELEKQVLKEAQP